MNIIKLMQSNDRADNLRAKYLIIYEWREGLGNMLYKYERNQLKFVPKSSFNSLLKRYNDMRLQLKDIVNKAKIEGIDL